MVMVSMAKIMEKTNIQCPVCDSGQSHLLYAPWAQVANPGDLYGAASGLRGTQRLVRCDSCSLIYENPRYPEEVILAGYTSSEEAGHDSQYPMRVKSFLRTLVKLEGYLPPKGAKILDIGTAGGAFLEAAGHFGYDAYGMEPSRFLVEKGKARGLKIEQGTIDNHPFPAQHFDMITLWDVIEHLTDPKSALIEIHKLLKPGGVLLINYPDISTWQAKLAGKRFWWILSVHLHHFSPATIREICKRTGFDAFYFKRYWQTLEFGYLERMAIHYKIPLAALITKLTPGFIQRIPIPYYASQTTALARRAS